ncbi:type II secretion system F family protein [Desulfobacula sp.]|uniref:type II secretion system F family protein n=1 Tax=Desulfobacula sp. TaxID=2593537 RepID=UPI0025C15685|nr:type II secretion system F family protein [Desulfobacula sp.]MBC2704564.1 type II secretion system F family protein [Desulfobacula sp.]
MSVFEYQALSTKGKKVSGIIDAESASAAKYRLRQKDIFLTALSKIESGSTVKERQTPSFRAEISLFSTVSSSELSMLTRQMSTLLSAGFPLVKVMGTLIPQTKSKTMQKVLSRIKDAIEEGSSFANALELYPTVFSPVFINMVKAGESSGTLEIVLERLADFTEHKEDSKKKIQAALAYPILMSLIGLVVLIILLTYVVPGIVTIFSDMNHALPLPTMLLISVSSFFKSYWWGFVLTPVLVFLLVFLIRKTEKGAWFIDKLLLSLPAVGTLLKKLIAARFTRTLGSLLDNGVPMLKALNITKNIAGNRVMYDLISTACDTVEQGGELGDVLSQSSDFPYLASQMIKIGETSGDLEKMLEKTADLFDKDVQTAVTAATSLIEPLIILIMGVVVGGIVLSICLPIFEINQLIQ